MEPAGWPSELAGRASVPAVRTWYPARTASEPAGRALKLAGRPSELAGRASNPAGRTQKPTRTASEPAGRD